MVAIIQQGIFIRTDINNASGIAQRKCSITAARCYQCKAITCCRAGPRVRHKYFEITCCLTGDVELIALMISHIGTHIKISVSRQGIGSQHSEIFRTCRHR